MNRAAPDPALSPAQGDTGPTLIRIAGLPLRPVIDGIPPLTARHVAAAAEARVRMDVLTPAAIAALHAAIPGLARADRGAALALKRRIHAGRWPEDAPDRDIADLVGDPALHGWCAAAGRAQYEEQNAAISLAAETAAHLRPRLHALFRRDRFLRPLALAAPSLPGRLPALPAPDRPAGKKSRQTELSLLSYLLRASAKTSPFSTFLYFALASDVGRPAPDWTAGRTACWLTPCAAQAFRGTAGPLCGLPEHARYRIEPNLRWTSTGADSFQPRARNRRGRIVATAAPVRVGLSPALVRGLLRLEAPFGWADLIGCIAAAAPSESAWPLAHRLIAAGLVVPLPGGCHCDQARGRRRRLARMTRAAAGLVQASATVRSAGLRRIEALGGPALRRNLASGSPVFETAWFDDPVACPGLAPDRARDLRRAISPRVCLSYHFASARAAFLRLYGAGGTCIDVPDFLHRLPALIARIAPPEPPAPGADCPLKVPATVMFQIGDGPAAPIVLNEIHTGCGWLSAHHTRGSSPFAREIHGRLTAWLARIAGADRPAEILAGGRASDLQIHRPLTGLAIRPPGAADGTAAPEVIDWCDLTLHHRPDTGAIDFVHRGRRLAPFYLGGTKPNLNWGPVYWLIALAAPHYIRPLLPKPPGLSDLTRIVAVPRTQTGRVVTRRACWWVSAKRLQDLWFARTGAGRLVDIRADCLRNGLPMRFFARRWTVAGAPDAPFELPKPLWVDVGHPLALDLLARETRRADFLCLTEALPAEPGADGHVREVQMELLV